MHFSSVSLSDRFPFHFFSLLAYGFPYAAQFDLLFFYLLYFPPYFNLAFCLHSGDFFFFFVGGTLVFRFHFSAYVENRIRSAFLPCCVSCRFSFTVIPVTYFFFFPESQTSYEVTWLCKLSTHQMLVAENRDNQQLPRDDFQAAAASRENEVPGVPVISAKHDAERKPS